MHTCLCGEPDNSSLPCMQSEVYMAITVVPDKLVILFNLLNSTLLLDRMCTHIQMYWKIFLSVQIKLSILTYSKWQSKKFC